MSRLERRYRRLGFRQVNKIQFEKNLYDRELTGGLQDVAAWADHITSLTVWFTTPDELEITVIFQSLRPVDDFFSREWPPA